VTRKSLNNITFNNVPYLIVESKEPLAKVPSGRVAKEEMSSLADNLIYI